MGGMRWVLVSRKDDHDELKRRMVEGSRGIQPAESCGDNHIGGHSPWPSGFLLFHRHAKDEDIRTNRHLLAGHVDRSLALR
jgi:hypothetical protein